MPERGVDDATSAVDARLALRTALARLGRRQRAVLVLRYFEDLTEPQVAEVLGCSVGTVKSQTSKALARLRASAPELSDFGRTDLTNGTEEVRA
jgi:RNA polymerase sigma factor (sigma-70 family)